MTTIQSIDDLDSLRAFYGQPGEPAIKKQLPQLDQHCRNFIALSPFLVIASAAAGGAVDASPRGDAPGFVAVLDDQTLLIPDRTGNNRVDTLSNVVTNPNIGLLFFVPGMNETLRVNGRARLITDAALLEPLSAGGKPPRAGLLVTVDEAFLQCAKALIRSDLWNADKQIERQTFPSLGKIIADQIGGIDPEATDRRIEEGNRTRLY